MIILKYKKNIFYLDSVVMSNVNKVVFISICFSKGRKAFQRFFKVLISLILLMYLFIYLLCFYCFSKITHNSQV